MAPKPVVEDVFTGCTACAGGGSASLGVLECPTSAFAGAGTDAGSRANSSAVVSNFTARADAGGGAAGTGADSNAGAAETDFGITVGSTTAGTGAKVPDSTLGVSAAIGGVEVAGDGLSSEAGIGSEDDGGAEVVVVGGVVWAGAEVMPKVNEGGGDLKNSEISGLVVVAVVVATLVGVGVGVAEVLFLSLCFAEVGRLVFEREPKGVELLVVDEPS